jgi:hypothetical protein
MPPIATAINATVPVPTRRNGTVAFGTMKACPDAAARRLIAEKLPPSP